MQQRQKKMRNKSFILLVSIIFLSNCNSKNDLTELDEDEKISFNYIQENCFDGKIRFRKLEVADNYYINEKEEVTLSNLNSPEYYFELSESQLIDEVIEKRNEESVASSIALNFYSRLDNKKRKNLNLIRVLYLNKNTFYDYSLEALNYLTDQKNYADNYLMFFVEGKMDSIISNMRSKKDSLMIQGMPEKINTSLGEYKNSIYFGSFTDFVLENDTSYFHALRFVYKMEYQNSNSFFLHLVLNKENHQIEIMAFDENFSAHTPNG